MSERPAKDLEMVTTPEVVRRAAASGVFGPPGESATHGNWFDEPPALEDMLRKAVKHYESDLRELADE